MINTIIGSGIFGLPSVVAGHLGRNSPWAYFIAGAGIAAIGGCLAEVASQFRDSGGPYLYAREALGRFWGVQIAWLTWLSRITAAAGTANLFTTYLGQVFPQATNPVNRIAILTLLIGVLASFNYIGVRSGTRVSDFSTALKMGLLASFLVAGLAWLYLHGQVASSPLPHPVGAANWLEAVLVLVYAYGGFEAVLLISGEMRDPRRDVPVALFTGIGTVAVVYTLVQVVVDGTLSHPAATDRPLAAAAGQILGTAGASVIAVGALISIYGYLSANMLHTPRLTLALAECGDFPVVFGRIHPKFQTPHISILIYTASLLAFTLLGNFRWNVTLSAIARLFTYSAVAVALIVLRRREPDADAFRLPGGVFFAVLSTLFCGVLLTRIHMGNLWVVAITLALGTLNWIVTRRGSSLAGAKAE